MSERQPDSGGFASPPPTYAVADDAGAAGCSSPRVAWQQPPEAVKQFGEPPSYSIYPGTAPGLPWAVPSGRMMSAGDLAPGHPLRPSYCPPSGLQPGYPPPPQYIGFAPVPSPYQQQVVVLGRDQGAVEIRAVENFWSHIVLACFVCWCCNLAFGAIAFVLAVCASNSAVYDPDRATLLGRASSMMSTGGIVVTIIIVIVVVAIVCSGGLKEDRCPQFTYNNRCFNSYCATCSQSLCYNYNGYYTASGVCYYNQ